MHLNQINLTPLNSIRAAAKRGKWLKIIALVMVGLGVCFRLANLDGKVYWIDEVATSRRIAGYPTQELIREIADARVVGMEDLSKYYRLPPSNPISATAHSLATEAPQSPPLYFTLVRLWVDLFGNTIPVIRALSAILSLLIFPAIFWLCLELFKSPGAAWIGMMIVAVSPFHVLYAQEARPYGLWTVTSLAASAALIRALRFNNWKNWAAYGVLLALSLYTQTFTLLVVVVHGIYVLLISRLKVSQSLIRYCIASVGALVGFLPWVVAVLANWQATRGVASWTAKPVDINYLLRNWALNFVRIFLDIEFVRSNPLSYLAPLILIAIVYSGYFLIRNDSWKVWSFPLILIGVNFLALAIPDLVSGGRRSIVPRYLIPCFLGIQLMMIGLFARKLVPHTQKLRQGFWKAALAVLLLGGIISCTIISQSQAWWNKYNSSYDPEIAVVINQYSSPLVVAEEIPEDVHEHIDKICEVLSLSFFLNEDAKFQFLNPTTVDRVSTDFNNIFLYRPSRKLLLSFQQRTEHRLEEVYSAGKNKPELWQLIQSGA